VIVGRETDRGPWVTALRAAGYQVFAINPLSAGRRLRTWWHQTRWRCWAWHRTRTGPGRAGPGREAGPFSTRVGSAHRSPSSRRGQGRHAVGGAASAGVAPSSDAAGRVRGRRDHPDADIYLSQPGFAVVLAGRTLGEFGDDEDRSASSRARKNYSGQSPITRASGKKSVVLAR